MSDEHLASTDTTGRVTVGGSVTGEIEQARDVDWFAVELVAGKTYRIDLTGREVSGRTVYGEPDRLQDPYLRGVHDAEGTLIAGTTDDNSGVFGRYSRNSQVLFTPDEDGTHYIAAGGVGGHTGTYRLSVTDIFAVHSGTAVAVEVGGWVAGRIDGLGERDWYAVELEAGTTYRVDLEGNLSGAGTTSDPILDGIYDAEGNFIPGTRDDNGGVIVTQGARVTFTPEKSGTYYIVAGERSGTSSGGTYALSVTDVMSPVVPFDISGGTRDVAVGGPFTPWIMGEVEGRGDIDWYAVELEAGKTYRVDLWAAWNGHGTLFDPYLHGVYDSDGNFVAGTVNDDGGSGRNSRASFSVTQGGTYYIAAGAAGGHPEAIADLAGSTPHPYPLETYAGTYQVSVTDVTPVMPTDDFTADTTTSGAVTVDGQATGEVHGPDDTDWFAVTLEAGKSYRIDIEGADTNAGTLTDPILRGLYDADGTLIADTDDNDSGNGANARLTFAATASGTHYIAAAGGAGEHAGSYRVSVTNLSYDDFTSDTTTSGAVAVGGQATGEIRVPSDTDWFAVTLEAGKSYRIDLEGTGTGAGRLMDPYLSGIHDADGVLIAGTTDDDGGRGQNSRVLFTPEDAGTYHIAASAHGIHTGTYRVSVTEIITDDFAADTGTSGRVEVGGWVAGRADGAGDRDWFAVELEAGTTYRVDLEGYLSGAGTTNDPILGGIHDAEGNLIPGTRDDNGGVVVTLGARVAFTPEQSGTYYIEAGERASSGGTYTLSVKDVMFPVVPFDISGGTRDVPIGTSLRGEIEERGDIDWFAVELEAGSTYQVDLEAAWHGHGTLFDPYLHGVYDSDGNFVAGTMNDEGGAGRNSRAIFSVTQGGTYYIVAGADGGHPEAFADLTGSIPHSNPLETYAGTYRVSVTNLASGDDFTADTTTTGTVVVGGVTVTGGMVIGDIESRGDVDWFAVELEADRTYRIDLMGYFANGTLYDSYLRGVYDADGVFIAGTADNDSGANRGSRGHFTAPETGTYYIAAAGHGAHTGTYRLWVTDVTPPDDFTSDTTTTGAVTVGGQTTGEIHGRDDTDWFAVTLEAGRSYRIDLEGTDTNAGTLTDPYLGGIRDADGALIAGTKDNDGGEGRNGRVHFTAPETGTYYIVADGHWDVRSGTYRVSVTDVTPNDDFTSDTATTGTVTVGGQATGELEEAGDTDWFAVTLEAGKSYRIDLEGESSEAGTLPDPHLLGLHDAGGTLIAGTANDDGGEEFNSRLTYAATQGGTYYIEAGAAEGTRPTGTYQVSVTEVTDDSGASGDTEGAVAPPPDEGAEDGAVTKDFSSDTATTGAVTDDFMPDTTTTGAVAVGGQATGEIEAAADVDWFAVALEAGKSYRIDLEGLPSGAGTLGNPILHGLYDAAGTLIAGTGDNNSGDGANARLTYTATASGTHYLAAGGVREHVGTYRVSVEVVTDDFTADTATTGAVTVGEQATGEIEAVADVDWFAVALEAGKTYRIDLEGKDSGAGTLRNPILHGLYDAAGTLIAGTGDNNGGDGANARLTYTATTSGTHYLAAGGVREHAGNYRVSVTEMTDDGGAPRSSPDFTAPPAEEETAGADTDDFAADTGTSGWVAVGDSATGRIHERYDADWFAVELEAGQRYRVDLEGADTGAGTLANPFFRGVLDAGGDLVAGTRDNNGGEGRNSLVHFTAEESGTHYLVASAAGRNEGTYRLSIEEAADVL